MSIHKDQLRAIIRKVLQNIDQHTPATEELLLGAAAQESKLGAYLVQLGGGPARGIFQMEVATEEDIWTNYLRYHSDVRDKLRSICGVVTPSEWSLTTNLAYQIAMCRFKYRMCPESIPSDLQGQAELWKLRYNTPRGAGTVDEYIANYNRYVRP